MPKKLPKNFGQERPEDYVFIRRDWFVRLNEIAERYEASCGVQKKKHVLNLLLGYISSAKTIIELL